MRGLADVAARIFSVLPFRPSPFHTGPGAGSGAGTAASIHRGVLSVACFGPAVLVRSTDRDFAPRADGAGGGAVRTVGPVFAQPPPSTVVSYLWRVSGLPYWYDRLTVTLRHALTGRVAEPFVPSAQSSLSRLHPPWCPICGVFRACRIGTID